MLIRSLFSPARRALLSYSSYYSVPSECFTKSTGSNSNRFSAGSSLFLAALSISWFSTAHNESNEKMKIALLQLEVGEEKDRNIDSATKTISQAIEQENVDLIVLPECWNSPYDTSSFPIYAEPIPSPGSHVVDPSLSPSFCAIRDLAREKGVMIVGGSIPEVDDGKVYNTSIIFNKDGELVGKHRF